MAPGSIIVSYEMVKIICPFFLQQRGQPNKVKNYPTMSFQETARSFRAPYLLMRQALVWDRRIQLLF
jgi:hypothetical protein